MPADVSLKCNECAKKIHFQCTQFVSLSAIDQKNLKAMIQNYSCITSAYKCPRCEDSDLMSRTEMNKQMKEMINMINELVIKNNELSAKMDAVAADINEFNVIKHETALITTMMDKLLAIEKLLKSEETKKDEIASKIDDKLDKIISVEKWSDVVKTKKTATPSLVIKPKDKNKKSEDVSAALKHNLNENEFEITGTRNANRNALIVNVKDEDNQARLMEEVSRKIGNDYEVTAIKNLYPRIKIINAAIPIASCDSNANIEKYLKDKNDQLKNAKLVLSIAREKRVEDQSYDIIMQVDKKTHEHYYIKHNRVDAFWKSCFVDDGLRVKRCLHCLKYGHLKRDCKEKDKPPTCAKCGERHLAKDCTNEGVKCVNCVEANKRVKGNTPFEPNHSAFSKNCPCYKMRYDQLANLVKYE